MRCEISTFACKSLGLWVTNTHPGRWPSGSVGGRIRLPNLVAIVLTVLLASLSSFTVAIGPPTNSLRLFTMYDVGWINPQTGQFGINITFFRPTEVAQAPGWEVMMKFKGNNVAVESFTDRTQYMLADDSNGTILVMNLKEQPPRDLTKDLVASDTAKGLRRMSVFINARVDAPANLDDLTPTALSLTTASDPSKASKLSDQLDFQVFPIRQALPTQPFGNFVAAQAVKAQDAPEEVPSPKGTDLVATTGLFAFAAVFVIASTTFGIGAIDKMNAAGDFRRQRNGGMASKG